MGVEAVEAAFPELPVVLQPVRGVLERLGLQPARPPLCVASARNQSGVLEHLQVLGDRRQADRERRRDLVDGRLAFGEPREDRPARRVGEAANVLSS